MLHVFSGTVENFSFWRRELDCEPAPAIAKHFTNRDTCDILSMESDVVRARGSYPPTLPEASDSFYFMCKTKRRREWDSFSAEKPRAENMPAACFQDRPFESHSTKIHAKNNKRHPLGYLLLFWRREWDWSPLHGLLEPAPAVHSIVRGFESRGFASPTKKAPARGAFRWRREWDSNPRRYYPRRFSRPVP